MNTTTTANIINTRLTEGFKTYLISKGYIFFINQYKEYSYLRLRDLEELPCFRVMIWQP